MALTLTGRLRCLAAAAWRAQPSLALETFSTHSAARAAADEVAAEEAGAPEPPGHDEPAAQLSRLADKAHAGRLRAALEADIEHAASPEEASPSERAAELELYRLHNSSLKFGGHLIRAKVLDIDRKKIVVDTGLRTAKIGLSDITPECIVGTTVEGNARRRPGEVCVGDVVQVYLEHEETPEGDMLVSGQQAAKERRFQAVWKELRDRMQSGQTVKGRVLNQLVGGYAVGVAGIVTFMPLQVCSRFTAQRIGELQDFKVVKMNDARRNVVVADAKYESEIRRQYPGGQARRQQPRPQKEVSRAADEIRAALGMGEGTG